MRKLLILSVLILLLMSMLLSACGSDATTTTSKPVTTSAPSATTKAPTSTTAPAKTTTVSPDAAKYGGVFVRSVTSGPSRPFGYPVEADNAATNYSRPVLESLVAVNKNGKIIPLLAESWEVPADGKSIILHLRQGVKFHDGSDFNAEVCKWNLDMMIEAKKTSDWTSIDIVDDHTLRLNVPQYKNTMLSNLALGMTQQISKESFDKNGVEWARWNPVGTGPFILDTYERDAKITYKRNPNYWQTGLPYLDGVELVVIADTSVSKLAFQKGDIHRLAASGSAIPELQAAGYEMKTEPAGTSAFVPDSKNNTSPWSSLNVRLAASYALDREGIATAVGFGHATAAYQLYPNFEQTTIPNLDIHKYSPDKAKSLLKEAGYPNGFKTMIWRFAMVSQDQATATLPMLKEVGINVELENPTSGKYTELRYNGWSDSLLLHAFNNYSNFVSMEDYFLGLQFPSLDIPAGFKEGLAAAASTVEPQNDLIQACMRVMYDDVMVIPIILQDRVTFLQKGVHDPGCDEYSLNEWKYAEMWLETSARK